MGMGYRPTLVTSTKSEPIPLGLRSWMTFTVRGQKEVKGPRPGPHNSSNASRLNDVATLPCKILN